MASHRAAGKRKRVNIHKARQRKPSAPSGGAEPPASRPRGPSHCQLPFIEPQFKLQKTRFSQRTRAQGHPGVAPAVAGPPRIPAPFPVGRICFSPRCARVLPPCARPLSAAPAPAQVAPGRQSEGGARWMLLPASLQEGPGRIPRLIHSLVHSFIRSPLHCLQSCPERDLWARLCASPQRLYLSISPTLPNHPRIETSWLRAQLPSGRH